MKRNLILFLFFCSKFLFAEETRVYVDSSFSKNQIGKGLNYFSTSKGLFHIDQLLKTVNLPWKEGRDNLLILTENDYENDLWISFKIINKSHQIQSTILELNNSLINHIEYYLVSDNKLVRANICGDAYPFWFRPISYRNPIYPILLQGNDSVQVFMKFDLGGRKIHIPLTLYKEEVFLAHAVEKELDLGFYYGILALLSLLFFYLYYLIKDRAFLYFAFYMGLHTLMQLGISGVASARLWPNFPYWADRSIAILMSFSIIAGLEFVIEFIKKINFKTWQLRSIQVFQFLVLFIVLLCFGTDYTYYWGVWVLYKIIPLFYFGMFLIAMVFYIRKYLPARIFILAFFAAIVSISAILFATYGGIHENVFTNNMVVYGEMFKCILLGFALLDRLRIFKEEKELAQMQVIEHLEELNTYKENLNSELEQKVNQKSRELIEKQNEVNRALIYGEEKERKRVAQELHDGMGSLLSTLRLNAESIDLSTKNLNIQETLAYQNVLEMIDMACTELRNISHNMLPAEIELFGLIPTIKGLVRKINDNGNTQFVLDVFDMEWAIDKQLELNIYRILLELVNNVIKHAKAKQATIQILRGENSLSLIVADEGVGFDISIEQEGIGLFNLKSRTAALNGKISIDSTIGKGTTVIINIPLNTYE